VFLFVFVAIRDNKRSLFIFSEDNLVRKYAKIIIEWGYPLHKLLTLVGQGGDNIPPTGLKPPPHQLAYQTSQ